MGERIRRVRRGREDGPVLVLFAGIHGNETAGVKAVERVFGGGQHGDGRSGAGHASVDSRGSAYVILGNLGALARGLRYIDTDLNRMWEETGDPILRWSTGSRPPAELEEFRGMRAAIDTVVERHGGGSSRIVFADLHTTSARSCAFILLNDTLENRRLAAQFPVPQILGIEEAIRGTVLSYIDNLGHSALGFEAGEHGDPVSVDRAEAFIRLLLEEVGVEESGMVESERRRLRSILRATEQKRAPVPGGYYAIRHHHVLSEGTSFRMDPGYLNFDPVRRGQDLATEDGRRVAAPRDGRIFMPLYQQKGRDGFLIVARVARIWLEVSKLFRGRWVHGLMSRLPGVRAISPTGVEVDLRVARFLVEPLFHLTGYRVLRKSPVILVCYRR